jgi:hypothetical protein
MQLTRVLSPNQTKAMTTATRRGETVYFYGSKGDVYHLTPTTDTATGEVRYACTCLDYLYRRAARGEQCKHGEAYAAPAPLPAFTRARTSEAGRELVTLLDV